ncbi:MAG: NAD-dependent protein deacylase, partial [Promethearchaeota archaeon]
ILVGSSLAVSPANFMPNIAKNYGAYIIFINRDNTLMDNLADVFLKGSASQIFTELMKKTKQ